MNKKIALGNLQSLTYIQKNLTACFYFIKSILPFHEIMLIKQIIFLYEAFIYLFIFSSKQGTPKYPLSLPSPPPLPTA